MMSILSGTEPHFVFVVRGFTCEKIRSAACTVLVALLWHISLVVYFLFHKSGPLPQHTHTDIHFTRLSNSCTFISEYSQLFALCLKYMLCVFRLIIQSRKIKPARSTSAAIFFYINCSVVDPGFLTWGQLIILASFPKN